MDSIAEKTNGSLARVRALNGRDGEDLILLHAYSGQFKEWYDAFQKVQKPEEKKKLVVNCLDALVGSEESRALWEVMKSRFVAYADRDPRVADAVGALFGNLVPLKSYALRHCSAELEKRGLLDYLKR